MEKQFVKMELDVFAKWQFKPPMYRVYVNDELFISATPGIISRNAKTLLRIFDIA